MYYIFGDCTLDTERYEFQRAGASMPLRRKAFQLLVYLLARRERVISRDELLEHLWPDQVIGDAVLNSCLRTVRQALADSGQAPRYIQTLRGLGYYMIAAVEVYTAPPQRRDAPAAVTPTPACQANSERSASVPPAPAVQSCPACACGQSLEATFCTACGARLHQICPHCQGRVRLPTTLCRMCGQSLEATPASSPSASIWDAAPLAASARPTPIVFTEEYKQVTFLCGGLAGAREIAVQRGPEAMHELMQAFFMLAQDVVQRYEGTLTQFEADGFVGLFGAPMAHEDHARRAVLAALGLHQRLRASLAFRGQQQGNGPSIRIGLHTGSVVVGHLGSDPEQLYTAAGETSHLARHLQQLAGPGTMLISEATYRLVQGEVQAEAWEVHVRAASRPAMPVYTVRGLIQRRAGVPSRHMRLRRPFVGRERELALLHERLTHAKAACAAHRNAQSWRRQKSERSARSDRANQITERRVTASTARGAARPKIRGKSLDAAALAGTEWEVPAGARRAC